MPAPFGGYETPEKEGFVPVRPPASPALINTFTWKMIPHSAAEGTISLKTVPHPVGHAYPIGTNQDECDDLQGSRDD